MLRATKTLLLYCFLTFTFARQIRIVVWAGVSPCLSSTNPLTPVEKPKLVDVWGIATTTIAGASTPTQQPLIIFTLFP